MYIPRLLAVLALEPFLQLQSPYGSLLLGEIEYSLFLIVYRLVGPLRKYTA